MEMNSLFDQYTPDLCLPFWAKGWEERLRGLTSFVMLCIAGLSSVFWSIKIFSWKKRYIGLGLSGVLFFRESWNAVVCKTTVENGVIKRFGH